jgi:hypothetical protein
MATRSPDPTPRSRNPVARLRTIARTSSYVIARNSPGGASDSADPVIERSYTPPLYICAGRFALRSALSSNMRPSVVSPITSSVYSCSASRQFMLVCQCPPAYKNLRNGGLVACGLSGVARP